MTADPHAYNALKHDYKDVPPVEHISQVIAREVKAGNIKFDDLKTQTTSTPITTPATWAATIRFTTIPAVCSTPYQD